MPYLNLTLKKLEEEGLYTFEIKTMESDTKIPNIARPASKSLLRTYKLPESLPDDLSTLLFPDNLPENISLAFNFQKDIILQGNIPKNSKVHSTKSVTVLGSIH